MKKLFLLLSLVFVILSRSSFAANSYIGTYVYTVSANDTKIFKSTEDIFKILDAQVGLVYPDTSSLIAGMESALSDYPESMPYIKSVIRDTLRMPSKLQDSLCFEEQGVDCPVSMIHLDSNSAALLEARLIESGHFQKLSPAILKFFNDLAGVSFPDSVLFHRYAISLIVASMGLCTSEVNSIYSIFEDVLWTDDEFSSVMEEWKAKKIDKHFLDFFRKKRSQKKACSDKVRNNIQLKVDSVYSMTLRPVIVPILQKYYAFDSIAPIWNGDGCGCVQKQELNGTVYAFYPYWFSLRKDKTLDFSAISRIAYYGINADNMGKLRFPASSEVPINFFAESKNLQFVMNAHKHDVRVDWTIEKNEWPANWDSLSMEKRRAFFDTLCREIVNLITPELPSSFRNFTSMFTYSGSEMKSRGDGVTLYFEHYPSDSISTVLFNEFFFSLRGKLKTYGDYFFVNLLMSHPDLVRDSGIYSYKNFRALLNSFNESSGELSQEEIKQELRSYLLVIMDEPLMRTKREIYSELDERLRGDDHKILMQSLTPVIWFDNSQWQELKDDIDYYADAYYNIGIAPYDVSSNAKQVCAENGSLAACILQGFEVAGTSHARQGFVQGFVCTNRWLFRVVHVVVCLLSLIFLVCYFAICGFRVFIGRKQPLFIALLLIPVILFSIILLIYDPALSSMMKGNYLIAFAVMFVFVIGVILALFFTYDKDLPMRKNE
ncbi:MAG: hypothetical protein M0P13_04700 [Fibrobacteraceae bacterium]|nr:hypothetical protein [Fibrobacteraceae bacterium]